MSIYLKPQISVLPNNKGPICRHSLSNLTPEEVTVLKQCLASSLDPLQTETETDNETETDIETEEDIETETDTQTPSQRRDVLQCLYLSVSSIADQVREFTDRRISRLKCDDTSLIPNFPQIHRHLSFKLISVARLMTSQTVWCGWPPLISSSSLFK